ncbi:LytTR family transcriptional regulator DNA-binding domain-containing protein [Chungangia koreensis]|uniref:LytTR family transcriptional regulator DNA-binding domain-containing protein n=1 Tax=Chungangia koreensis TaxID=752657 RepID=A0ABV8X4M7_9LACT
MTLLTIEKLAKRNADTLVFPSFDLQVDASVVAAIHCHVNIREMLIHIIEGSFQPSEGYISVNGIHILDRQFAREIGICTLSEGYYERLTILDHLKFYKDVYESDFLIEDVALILGLKDQLHHRLTKCSLSEVKRVQFSRLLFADPKVIVFEEPLQNVDLETHRIFINFVEYLTLKGKAVLILTGNMESALTVTDRVYRLGEEGLIPYEVEEDSTDSSLDTEEVITEVPAELISVQQVRFEKIPAKVNEKIILFSPTEIDYIESSDGSANIMIDGESYPSDFKMNELEERLLPYGFYRCHRSYIVNLQRVREVITWTRNSYSLVLDDRDKSNIPLSKTKMSELKGMIGLK